MQPFLTALVAKFAATTGITSLVTGGLHQDKAMLGTEYPFMLFHVLSAPTDARFGHIPSAPHLIFILYGVSNTAVLTAMLAFTDAFDTWQGSLTAGEQFFTLRHNDPVPYRAPKSEVQLAGGADAESVFAAEVEYEFGIQP